MPAGNRLCISPDYIMRNLTEKAFFLLLGLLLFTSTQAQAQDATDCATAITGAETAYFNGDFDLTIALLQPCLNSENYTQAQGTRGYSLLGRTQFVLGDTEAARSAVEGLYQHFPEYEPDPQLPPNYTAFVLEVKQQMIAVGSFPSAEEEAVLEEPASTEITEVVPDPVEEIETNRAPRKRKALLWGGGAALAVAAGAAVLLSGSGGNGGGTEPPPADWPFPPTHPSGQ